MLKPKTIVRIVGGLVLATVLVLAVLEFMAKTAAEKTAQAWGDIDIREDPNVPLSKFEEEMSGSPKVKDLGGKKSLLVSKVYTWEGIFRSYSIRLMVHRRDNTVKDMLWPYTEE